MDWELIKGGSGRNEAYASVGYGRIDISANACALISNYSSYSFAKIYRGTENGKVYIGIELLKKHEENSVQIKYKIQGGKRINGMTISDKYKIEQAFGKIGSKKAITKYNVITRPRYDNMLIIPDKYETLCKKFDNSKGSIEIEEEKNEMSLKLNSILYGN